MKAAKKYLRLTREFLSRRETGLTEAEENDYLDRLDKFWHDMSDDEIDYVERTLAFEEQL